MSFTSFVQRAIVPSCCWYKNGLVFKRRDDGTPIMDFQGLKIMTPSEKLEFEKIVEIGGNAQLTNLYALNKLCTQGAYLLKADNFEELESTDLTIQVQDYSQPFPTIVVQLPKEYSLEKSCDDPYAGTVTPISGVQHGDTHRPDFVIISHDAEHKVITAVIYLTSMDIYAALIPENGETIEQALTTKLNEHKFKKSLEVTEQELLTYSQVIRASLNACMLAADFGITTPEPENPKHLAKLIKWGKTRLAKLQPKVFKLLYVFENNGTRSPHWRRAHWRMQRHGPGLTLQKRIRIARTWIGGSDDRPNEPTLSTSGNINPDC